MDAIKWGKSDLGRDIVTITDDCVGCFCPAMDECPTGCDRGAGNNGTFTNIQENKLDLKIGLQKNSSCDYWRIRHMSFSGGKIGFCV